MGELTACPECGRPVPADSWLCPHADCNAEIGGFAAPALTAAPVRVAAVTPPAEAAPPVRTTACPGCGEPVPDGAADCPECGHRRVVAAVPGPDAAVAAHLVLPDGSRVPLLAGERVEVGRDVPDPRISRGLAGSATASRVHAALTVRAGTVAVEHLSRTNNTYVNGREAVGRHVFALEDGVVVGLGRQVTVRVLPA
ncbi:FHA domain-containing protein [Xylanimonas protaetiae]|uniref:FHA domain-containing protein n=1 Tax=Xylanimonas protaetiae TaxID=2509457 RepID=A0A4P6FAY4_9MICO|nr:zinc ribbon domain-containing protein [Xylanimonas protaetiae]QAY71439.1 FHA domain-containing protein [Xylanimonas protaetiae]